MRTVKHESDPGTPERSALKRVMSDPLSRRRFVVAGGSGSALALFVAACGGDDDEPTSATNENSSSGNNEDTSASASKEGGTEQFGKGDLGIVNYALTLEYLEAAFYDDVVRSGLFKGAEQTLIKQFGANEQTHVEALEQTANMLGKAAKAPKTEFPLDSAEEVLALAATVENVGAAAYLGQAALIESEDVLAAALSIHTVEARHAAVLNMLAGEPITPDGAFAVPMTAEQVLPQVMEFIVA